MGVADGVYMESSTLWSVAAWAKSGVKARLWEMAAARSW
jgi:hypothetical protein